MQDELGLNFYDMDMRDYDPATARWTGIDPVTHFSQSPYNAFDGNPVLIADPSGADGVQGSGYHSNSLSNNPFAAGNAAVSNTGAWSGNTGGAFGFGDFAPSWGDGYMSPYLFSTDKRTWVSGGTGIAGDGEVTVFSGHWEQNSTGGLGISGAQTAGVLATESLLLAGAYGALQFIGTDLLIPEPTDLFVPKYVAYAVVAIVATAIIYASVDHFAKQKSSESVYNTEAEHVSNARASTKATHESGQARKGRDKGGEKGDARRTRYK